MKILNTLLFILFITNFAICQSPTIEFNSAKSQKKSLSQASLKILGHDNDGYYALRLIGSFGLNNKLAIDYYNKDMELISSFKPEEIVILNKRPGITGKIFDKGKTKSYEFALSDSNGVLHVFHSTLDKEKSRNYLYRSALDKATMTLGKPVRVGSHTFKAKKEDRRGSYGYTWSEDKNHFAIVSLIKLKKEEVLKAAVMVIDNSMAPMWKKNATISLKTKSTLSTGIISRLLDPIKVNTLNAMYNVTSSGNVHFTIKGSKKNDTKDHTYLYSLYPEERPKTTKLKDGDKVFTDILLKEINGKLTGFAFYGTSKEKRTKLFNDSDEPIKVEGITQFEIAPTTHLLSNIQKYAFDKEQLISLLTTDIDKFDSIEKRKKRAEKHLEKENRDVEKRIDKEKEVAFDKRLLNIYPGENGDITLIIEGASSYIYHSSRTTGTGANATTTTSSRTIYTFDNIHFINISKTKINWIKSVDRHLRSSYNFIGSSTFTLFNGNLYMVFADLIKLKYAVLDPTGNLHEGTLINFDNEDKLNKYTFFAKGAYLLSANEIVGFSHRLFKSKSYFLTLK